VAPGRLLPPAALPEPIYASDATIALSMFMAATANGATMATPGIKR